jgi:poly(A) polymerase
METKNTKSAICFIPPIEHLAYIQGVREKHDGAYQRWMPHINLVFPFVNSDKIDKVAHDLQSVLSKATPFEIKFEQFDFFSRKKNATVHLVPDTNNDECLSVYNLIVKTLGMTPDERGYHPHMTVGQFKKNELTPHMVKLMGEFEEHKFGYLCDKIYIIERTDDTPFQVVKTINIGS